MERGGHEVCLGGESQAGQRKNMCKLNDVAELCGAGVRFSLSSFAEMLCFPHRNVSAPLTTMFTSESNSEISTDSVVLTTRRSIRLSKPSRKK